MDIECGIYNNVKFEWVLIPQTDGQMQVVLEFQGLNNIYNKISDRTIMNAFGFKIKSDNVSPSHFSWHRWGEDNKFCISWTFMFVTLPYNSGKYKFLNHIFTGIDKIHKAYVRIIDNENR